MKLSFLLIMLLCFSTFPLKAQGEISGQIENWNDAEAKIIFVDIFSGYTRELGKIEKDGTLIIPLEEDFLTSIKAEMKKEQEKAPENSKISLKNVKKSYSCQNGDLEYQNPEAPITGLPKHLYVVKEEKEMLGLLMPASSKSIAQYVSSGKNAETGKYLEWVYLDEEAEVKGDCYSHGFTDNATFKEIHHFDLYLKQGWNIVQYEIQETFEDETGKTYPKEIEWTSVEKIPEDIKWIFTPGRR